MNWLIMGQNYHLVHHLWPSIPWFHYKPAYEAVKPLLDVKGSPQRLGIYESGGDLLNFLYDVFLGIRSHKRSRSRLRNLVRIVPSRWACRQLLHVLHRTAVTPLPRRS